MQVTMTIYRRGVNWKRMPKKCAFVAFTRGGFRLVLVYNPHKRWYQTPFNISAWWLAKEIVAWFYLPELESKP